MTSCLQQGSNATTSIRLLQWNILAHGLGHDGFLASGDRFMPRGMMEMIRQAKAKNANSNDDISHLVNALGQVQRHYQDAPELHRVDEEILHWEERFPRIKQIIAVTQPDILTLQEMDQLRQFLHDPDLRKSYTSLIRDDDDKTDYKPPQYDNDDPGLDDLGPSNYMNHLVKVGAAFAPKAYSTARKLKKKRSSSNTTNRTSCKDEEEDDDGVAIFWKRDKFRALELAFLRFPLEKQNDSKAVLAVVLQDLQTGQTYNVVTTHLPAGDSNEKEEQRLQALQGNASPWEARRLCRQPSNDNGTFQETAFEQTFTGLVDFLQYWANRQGITVLGMDSNSRPLFPFTTKHGTNVWREISKTGLTSAWVLSRYLQADGHATDAYRDTPYIVSVNKMRGPASAQLDKIGEHKVELIDHVFTNAPSCQIETSVMVEGRRLHLSPLLYDKNKTGAEHELLPSVDMPSDHCPILVTIGSEANMAA